MTVVLHLYIAVYIELQYRTLCGQNKLSGTQQYYLSVQDEETREEGTLIGHKECLRYPIVSKDKADCLTKD